MVDLLVLGGASASAPGSPAVVEQALLLAGAHSVRVEVASAAEVRALVAAGFVVAPAAIESFVRTPIDLDTRPRRYRRTIRASLDAWHAAGLAIELVPLSALGIDCFLETVYFPLFLRTMYARGIAPHGANQLAAMVALLESGEATTVALVRAGPHLVGAALLGRAARDASAHALRGDLPTGPWEQGLIYALHDSLQACRRAFMIELARALAGSGASWFSLGRDAAWCEEGYDGVFFEKLHLADSVVAAFGERTALFSWAATDDEHFMFFAWDQTARALRPRNHGCSEDRFAPIAAALGAPRVAVPLAPAPPLRPSAAT